MAMLIRTQGSQVIPAAAVEAAARALAAVGGQPGNWTIEDSARAALEAAAPHIRAQALEDAADSRETERLFVFGWEARERLRTRAAAERGGE